MERLPNEEKGHSDKDSTDKKAEKRMSTRERERDRQTQRERQSACRERLNCLTPCERSVDGNSVNEGKRH